MAFLEWVAVFILHAFFLLVDGWKGMIGKRRDAPGLFLSVFFAFVFALGLSRFGLVRINMHRWFKLRRGVPSVREALLRLALFFFFQVSFYPLHQAGPAPAGYKQGKQHRERMEEVLIYNCELLLDGYTPSIIRPSGHIELAWYFESKRIFWSTSGFRPAPLDTCLETWSLLVVNGLLFYFSPQHEVRATLGREASGSPASSYRGCRSVLGKHQMQYHLGLAHYDAL